MMKKIMTILFALAFVGSSLIFVSGCAKKQMQVSEGVQLQGKLKLSVRRSSRPRQRPKNCLMQRMPLRLKRYILILTRPI